MTLTAVEGTSHAQSRPTVTVAVYGLTTCSYTVETRLALSDAGIDFDFVELTHNPKACEYVASFDCYQTPFVVATIDGHPYNWSGHRPDQIAALAAAHRTA